MPQILRKILATFLLLGVIAFNFSLWKTVWQSFRARSALNAERARIEQLEKKVENLREEVQEATSSFRLEERARNELKLKKPEETVIEIQ